jgi:hypothetical protein
MLNYEDEDENDTPLTEGEIEELMLQVNIQVSQQLKKRDEQLISMQKSMTNFMKSVRVLSDATKEVVKKRSPGKERKSEKQPQTNNYMSPYRQQRKSSSPSIDKNNSQRHEYNSPYRQRANAPPIVQISKRNDAFFCNDY